MVPAQLAGVTYIADDVGMNASNAQHDTTRITFARVSHINKEA